MVQRTGVQPAEPLPLFGTGQFARTVLHPAQRGFEMPLAVEPMAALAPVA